MRLERFYKRPESPTDIRSDHEVVLFASDTGRLKVKNYNREEHTLAYLDEVGNGGPGSGGIQFDKAPQDGDWLYLRTIDGAMSPNEWGFELNDDSSDGIWIHTQNRVLILTEGEGGISISSNNTLDLDARHKITIQGGWLKIFASAIDTFEMLPGTGTTLQSNTIKLNASEHQLIPGSKWANLFVEARGIELHALGSVADGLPYVMGIQIYSVWNTTLQGGWDPTTGKAAAAIGCGPTDAGIDTNTAGARSYLQSTSAAVVAPAAGASMLNVYDSLVEIRSALFRVETQAANTPVFEVRPDGTVHIKSGTSIIADL